MRASPLTWCVKFPKWHITITFMNSIDPCMRFLGQRQRSISILFLSQVDVRVDILSSHLSSNGFILSTDPDSLERLNTWFVSEVLSGEPPEVTPYIYSLCLDISIYLSNILMSKYEKLKWCLVTKPPRHVSFQRPVVRGFSDKVLDSNGLDLDYLMCQYAHRIKSMKSLEEGLFQSWITSAE